MQRRDREQKKKSGGYAVRGALRPKEGERRSCIGGANRRVLRARNQLALENGEEDLRDNPFVVTSLEGKKEKEIV